MVYLTTKEAAALLGYEESTVRKKAKNNEYKYRYVDSSAGQGGKKLEILLESLPDQAQRAYRNQFCDVPESTVNTDYRSTKAQKEKGELRAEVVKEYRLFNKKMKMDGVKGKKEIMDMFIELWNSNHPDFTISRPSLYRWMNKTKTGNVEKLVEHRGGYNKGQSAIPEYYQKKFDSLYLQQTQPSIASCYLELQLEANRKGEYIPSIKAFERYAKNYNLAQLTYAREGKKAFDDKYMPHIEQEYATSPNDSWVADHHLWDVFVRIPDGKGGWKLVRPWGSYWMDMRTRKVMSSIIRVESPNSDIVICGFGLGVEHFGIPKEVRLDNGKDYKAKDLFNPKGYYISSKEDEDKIFHSLSTNLQLKVVYSIPYNAKAKPIERLFNTFESQLGKKYPSYAGSNAKQRPEDLKDLDIMEVITLEEFIEHHNKYVYEIYNNTPHSGDSMYGKSPNQVYTELPFTLRRVSKEMLYFSLMRVKGTRVVGRNGVTFNGVHFYNENCINYAGKKVLARYNPIKPEVLYIFDMDENFLFIAKEITKRGFDLIDEDYRQENERKKLARQMALNSYTKDNIIRTTASIGERLEQQAESLEHAATPNPKTLQLIRDSKAEENIKRMQMSDMDRQYNDILKREAERKKAEADQRNEYIERFRNNMLNLGYIKQA